MSNGMGTNKQFDVLGLGCVAVDDLMYVPFYPPADVKMAIERCERQGGGLTETALVAASRLGSKCAYAGVLGFDELSEFVVGRFQAEGVDVSHLVRRAGVRPFHAVIIVDTRGKTRTIFYDAEGVVGADPQSPPAEVIRGAGVLFVDQVGMEGMIRAARIAREAHVPVVADCEQPDVPCLAELLELVDHLVVPREFASQVTSASEGDAAVRGLWNAGRDTVVVTDGPRGCWYSTRGDGGRVRHQPAFAVEVVDTTGCGDVFHGAYASALARGLGAVERIRFASAAAALKAMRSGGQSGIPDREAVEKFLTEQGTLPTMPA